MSRVAKAPVHLPKGVELTVKDQVVLVKGPKGLHQQHFHHLVHIDLDGLPSNQVTVRPKEDHPDAWMHAGTVRANLNNSITGVTVGFSKALEIIGVGYRAQVSGQKISLSLGFSHPVEYILPTGIVAEAPTNTSLVISGVSKELVGQVAAEIRRFRPPEPYKGKGIKYRDEVIQRKDPKKK